MDKNSELTKIVQDIFKECTSDKEIDDYAFQMKAIVDAMSELSKIYLKSGIL